MEPAFRKSMPVLCLCQAQNEASRQPSSTVIPPFLILLICMFGWPFAYGRPDRTPKVNHSETTFTSYGQKVLIERYRSSSFTPAIMLLCGAGGLRSSAWPCKDLVRRAVASGYQVYIPHYLPRAPGPSSSAAYRRYVHIVDDAVNVIEKNSKPGHVNVGLIGYSLGASVALAEASVNASIAVVISWNGSLPDEYVASAKLPATLVIQGKQDIVIPAWNAEQLMDLCQIRHFTCLLKLYPNQGHGFSSGSTSDAEDAALRFVAQYMPSHAE